MKDLTIAWAIQLDHAELGARIEARNETKDQIEALHHGLQAGGLSILGRLPREILVQICDDVFCATYRDKIAHWEDIRQCLTCCNSTTHFTPKETKKYNAIKKEYATDLDCFGEDPRVEGLFDMASMRHTEFLYKYVAYLEELVRCPKAESFSKDHGIHPYFHVTKKYLFGERYYTEALKLEPGLVKIVVKAYLTKSVYDTTLTRTFEPSSIYKNRCEKAFYVNDFISSDALQPLTEDGMRNFKLAMKALRLNPEAKTTKNPDQCHAKDDKSLGGGGKAEEKGAEDRLMPSKFSTQPKLMLLGSSIGLN